MELTRREMLAATGGVLLSARALSAPAEANVGKKEGIMKEGIMKEQQKAKQRGAQTIIGKLSGKKITIPDVNVPPMPALAAPGVIHNGKKAEGFGEIDSSRG